MAIKKFLFGTDSHGDQIDRETAKRFLQAERKSLNQWSQT